MDRVLIDIIAWVLVVLFFVSVFNAYKWSKWANIYQSKTLRYLRNSAITVTMVSLPLVVLALYRIFAGSEAPSIPHSGVIVALSLVVLIGNMSVTTFAFRELDDHDG